MSRKLYICNAFSLSMLDRHAQTGTPLGYEPHPSDSVGETARFPRPLAQAADYVAEWEPHAEIVSAVGHSDTAALFSSQLGREIEPNRVSVKLAPEDILVVGQYVGPRLPEGATELPEGAKIEWWVVV